MQNCNITKSKEILLIKPTIEYKNQAKEMIEETKRYDINNPDIWAGYSSMQKYTNYEEWLQKLENDLDFENIKPGRVPASTYFLLRKSDNKILGIINIRYELNEYLANYGGNIVPPELVDWVGIANFKKLVTLSQFARHSLRF